MALFDSAPSAFPLRAPCPCGSVEGRIEEVGGQDTVRCAECNLFQYNAPRTETGRRVRSISERPNLKPAQRARIIERDNGVCTVCLQGNRPITIAHLISVAEGRRSGEHFGIPEAETERMLFSDDNLCVMCEECNAGLGSRSVSPRLQFRLLLIQQTRKES